MIMNEIKPSVSSVFHFNWLGEAQCYGDNCSLVAVIRGYSSQVRTLVHSNQVST
jgi:hypothetical protein